MKHRTLPSLALVAALLFVMQTPLVALAQNARPSVSETITYDAGLQGTSTRPIAGEALSGRMRLTVSPDGTIQGTYIPQDGAPIQVSGGLGTDGNVWLTFGQITVMGQWHRNGGIVGSSFGPPAFDRLQFIAHPVYVQHSQERS